MRKLTNIRLKDVDKARLLSISVFKNEFGIDMFEAKELTKRILESGDIEATYQGFEWGSHHYRYIFENSIDLTVEHFESVMSKAFDYDLEKTDLPSNGNMREPCEETKKALAWLETLGEAEKEMVKLIGDWEHPISWAAPVC